MKRLIPSTSQNIIVSTTKVNLYFHLCQLTLVIILLMKIHLLQTSLKWPLQMKLSGKLLQDLSIMLFWNHSCISRNCHHFYTQAIILTSSTWSPKVRIVIKIWKTKMKMNWHLLLLLIVSGRMLWKSMMVPLIQFLTGKLIHSILSLLKQKCKMKM